MLIEYRIFETRQFDKDLRALARAGRPNVLQKLNDLVYPQLRRHPHFGPHVRKLRGQASDSWRYRIGAWRFFYEIDEEDRVVSMVAAAHRGWAY